MASTAVWIEPCPVMMMPTSCGSTCSALRRSSTPSVPGIIRSTARVADVIAKHFNRRFHHDHVGRFLRQRLNWTPQKPERRTRERDEDAIRRWHSVDFPHRPRSRRPRSPCRFPRRIRLHAHAHRPANLGPARPDPDPSIFPIAVLAGYQLVFAGHLHGGQCVLANHNDTQYPAAWFNPWHGLHFEDRGALMLVSRGAADTFPFRINCPREVILCEIS